VEAEVGQSEKLPEFPLNSFFFPCEVPKENKQNEKKGRNPTGSELFPCTPPLVKDFCMAS